MATWSGWLQQFLAAATLPNTDGNRTFLSDWAANESTACRDNPIDVSHPVGNSTDCTRLTDSRTAQNYTSHAQAATAFNAQLHSGNFPHLLAAFRGGDQYTLSGLPEALSDLIRWGSTSFVSFVENATGVTTGSGGGNSGTADALKGWQDIRHSLNRNLPAALRHSDQQMVRALHALGRARKVKL